MYFAGFNFCELSEEMHCEVQRHNFKLTYSVLGTSVPQMFNVLLTVHRDKSVQKECFVNRAS